jgi:hypothetical protein
MGSNREGPTDEMGKGENMGEQKPSGVAGILVGVASVLLLISLASPLAMVNRPDPTLACFLGFVPAYPYFVARLHAKKNGQHGLAAVSLVLMYITLCLALLQVVATTAISGMMH